MTAATATGDQRSSVEQCGATPLPRADAKQHHPHHHHHQQQQQQQQELRQPGAAQLDMPAIACQQHAATDTPQLVAAGCGSDADGSSHGQLPLPPQPPAARPAPPLTPANSLTHEWEPPGARIYTAGRFRVCEAPLFGPWLPHHEQTLRQMYKAEVSDRARLLEQFEQNRPYRTSEQQQPQSPQTEQAPGRATAGASPPPPAEQQQQQQQQQPEQQKQQQQVCPAAESAAARGTAAEQQQGRPKPSRRWLDTLSGAMRACSVRLRGGRASRRRSSAGGAAGGNSSGSKSRVRGALGRWSVSAAAAAAGGKPRLLSLARWSASAAGKARKPAAADAAAAAGKEEGSAGGAAAAPKSAAPLLINVISGGVDAFHKAHIS